MNKSTKQGIDIVVPGVGAIAVGVYFILKEKDRSVGFLLMVLVVSFILLYAVTTQATKAIMANGEKPADVKLTGDSSTGINSTTGEKTGFDVDGWVNRVHKDVYAPFFSISVRDEDLYASMKTLGNDDLIAMWNRWNKVYFSEEAETMTEAIDAEFTVWTSPVNRDISTIIERLKKLGCK